MADINQIITQGIGTPSGIAFFILDGVSANPDTTPPVVSSGHPSLFGKRKFGTFRFGPTVLSNPRYGLEVDWKATGLFTGENEGVNLIDMSIERGRKYTFSQQGDAFEVEDTGRFSATLLDFDSRYDPYSTSSPLYGYLTGGKRFRVKVRTMEDTIYPLMAGVLSEPVSFNERGVMQARLEGTDGWAVLRSQMNEVTVPLQEGIYVDDAMKLVLNKAGWPRPWGYDLDVGVDERDYFWVDARSAAQVIHELAHNELGSVSLTANGDLRFRSRVSQEAEVLELERDDCIRIRKLSPSEVIRNMLKVVSSPRSEEVEQEVWALPSRLEVDAGETISDVWAQFKYNNEVVPCKDPVTPTGSDYSGSANADGSGADLTANISVTMNAFSTKAQLSVTNNGISPAYVYVRVRAKPISKASSVSFQYRDEASIKQFGARPFGLNIDQNVNVARQYRELLALFMTTSRNYLVVDLLPNPEKQFKADLGDIIRANFSHYGINQAFKVIGISHKFRDVAGINVDTRWWLEPFTRLFAGVQVPMQVPFQLGG